MSAASSPERIEFADGRFGARDTNRSFDFFELAAEAAQHDLPADLATTASRSSTDNEMHEPVFPNGCAVCEVEVDPRPAPCDHPLCVG